MRTAALVLCFSVALSAQEPVRTAPDVISWGTAAANPLRATWQVLASDNQTCRLVQLGLSAAITNATVAILKHTVNSARPCAGCRPDGFPSGHVANSLIGSGQSWTMHRGWSLTLNMSLGALTGWLRQDANRHTWRQVAVGAGIGIGGEWASRLLVRCDE